MSAPGQSRRFDRAPPISGLPPLADILSVIRHVSKVPQPDSCTATKWPRYSITLSVAALTFLYLTRRT
jgi:hypothetical protein